MKRRKMLMGLGALAAGASTGIGTGALSSGSRLDRSAKVNVVSDGSQSAEIYIFPSTVQGNNHGYLLEYTSSGVKLVWEDEGTDNNPGPGTTGKAVNSNGFLNYDNVFETRYMPNQNTGNAPPIEMWVELENFPTATGDNWVYYAQIPGPNGATDYTNKSTPNDTKTHNSGDTGQWGVHLNTNGVPVGAAPVLDLTFHMV